MDKLPNPLFQGVVAVYEEQAILANLVAVRVAQLYPSP